MLTIFYKNNNILLYKMIDVLVNGLYIIALLYIPLVFLINIGIDLEIKYFIKTYVDYGIVRVAFLFNEPLLMGFYFIIALFLSDLLKKRFYIRLVFIVGIVLSFSLSAYLLLVFYFFMKNLTFNLKKLRFYILIVGSIILIVISMFIFSERIEKVFSFNEGSTRIRIALTLMALSTFLDNWIIGVGIGNSSVEMIKYFNDYSSSINFDITYSSNLYLSILSEFGILGFSFFLLFIGNLIIEEKDRGLFVGLLTICMSFISNSLLLTPLMWIYFLIIKTRN